jgi:hypothetical protein
MRNILLYILILSASSVSAQMQMRLRGTYEPVYVPNQLDSLFYWFAADRSVLDSAGTSIEDYEGVGTWADLSGRNHDVLQTVATQYPQYRATGGPNNKPAIYFDGDNDFLASAAHWWESDDITIFVVMRFENATRDALEAIVARDESATTSQWRIASRGASESYALYVHKSSNGALNTANVWNAYSTSSKSTSFRTWATTWAASAPTGALNGASTSYTPLFLTAGPNTVFDDEQATTIGAIRSTPIAFLQGYISEIIVYSRALTASERIGVESYLKNKYAL